MVPSSSSVSFPTPGTFYWQAAYSGDGNNAKSTSACTSETLTVTSPIAITTTASGISPGGLVSDSATLTGSSNLTGKGTITFKLYGPSATAMCSGTPVYTATDTGITSNGPFSSGGYMPVTNAGGTFWWTASFSGDANNPAATSACGAMNESVSVPASPPTVKGAFTCTNGIYRGTQFTGNVTVANNSDCVLVDVTIVGSLSVGTGAGLVDYGSTVEGKQGLTASGAAWLDIRGGTIGMNLNVTGTTGAPPSNLGDGATANDLCSTTIDANVTVANNGTGAPFEIGGGPDCATPLTILAGNFQVEGNAGHLTIGPANNGAGNSLGKGDIAVENNTGGGTLTDNSTGRGDCHLDDNTPGIVGTGNTSSGNNMCNTTD
jgi:hypothetical protein